MAKLRAYNRSQLPGVAPTVNYYDGKDLYNIAGTLSKLRRPKDDSALNDAMAEYERFLTQERRDRESYPDQYSGDLDRRDEAYLTELETKAGLGNAAAVEEYKLYQITGKLNTINTHHSDFESRGNELSAELAERYGLSGSQLKMLNTAVYRANTLVMDENAMAGDIAKDKAVLEAGKATWANYMDAGEVEMADITAKTMYQDGNISQDGMLLMIQTNHAQRDMDGIKNVADIAYKNNPSMQSVKSTIDAYISNSDNFDGTGLRTLADRELYVAEYIKELQADTIDRQNAAVDRSNERFGYAYEIADQYRRPDSNVGAGTVMREIRSLEDYLVENRSAQGPDKEDEAGIQRTIDYLYGLFPTGDDDPATMDPDSEWELERALQEAKRQGLASGESQSATIEGMRNISVTDSNGKEWFATPDMMKKFWDNPAELFEQGVMAIGDVLDNSGLSSEEKLRYHDSQMEALKALGPNITPADIDRIKNGVVEEVTKTIMNDDFEGIPQGWFGREAGETAVIKANGEIKQKAVSEKQNAELNTLLTDLNTTPYHATDNNMSGMLSSMDAFKNLTQTHNGTFAMPDRLDQSFMNSQVSDHFAMAGEGEIYTGTSKHSAYGRPTGMIITAAGGGHTYGRDNAGRVIEQREVFVANPDLNSEEGRLGLVAGQDEGQTFMIVAGTEPDGSPMKPMLMQTITTVTGEGQQAVTDFVIGEVPEAEAYIKSRVANIGMLGDEDIQSIRLSFILGETFKDPALLDTMYELSERKDRAYLDARDKVYSLQPYATMQEDRSRAYNAGRGARR